MNNILDFDRYKNYRYLNDSFNMDSMESLNEGMLDNFAMKWRKLKASSFVDKVLKDEIELGEEFEKKIKLTMDELTHACKKLQAKSEKSQSMSEFTEQVNRIIGDINKISFDTLTLIGDQNIDFPGFRNSVIMSNVVKFGVLLAPVRNIMMIHKAYNYFLGLIKQTVRKDLVMLIVNFDQFQSIILQKSMEASGNVKAAEDIATMTERIFGEMKGIIENVARSKSEQDMMLKLMKEKRQQMEQDRKYDSAFNSYMDAYNNTYKTTAETIKSLLQDDNQKQLEALKSGISRLGTGDDELTVYGELLITAAEEYALKSCNRIHYNFLKMSEVFKLSNQKNLIDMITTAEKEELKKIKKEKLRKKDMFGTKTVEESLKFIKDEFLKIKEKTDLGRITIDELYSMRDNRNIVFTYRNDKLSPKEERKEMSEYDVIVYYLSNVDDGSELSGCSRDVKLLIPSVRNYDNSFISYAYYLSDYIEKSLVKKSPGDDKCSIDFMVLDSVDDIVSVLNKFDILNYNEDTKKKHEKVFRCIGDTYSIKFENVGSLLNKFMEISDMNKGLERRIKSNPREAVKEYYEYIKEYEKWSEWDVYHRKYNHFEELKDKDDAYNVEEPKEPNFPEPSKKPKMIGDSIQLKTSINGDRYSYWKDSLKTLGQRLRGENMGESKKK